MQVYSCTYSLCCKVTSVIIPTGCNYIQELWVKSKCEARGKHGPDGWRELTLEERKSLLLALWKEDHEKVKKK